MAFKNPYNQDPLVAKILDVIKSLISSGERVYYVNVHCVGVEYRIGHYSLEAVCSDWRTWYNFKTNIRTKLTENQYQKIFKVLRAQWELDGKLTKERGLY